MGVSGTGPTDPDEPGPRVIQMLRGMGLVNGEGTLSWGRVQERQESNHPGGGLHIVGDRCGLGPRSDFLWGSLPAGAASLSLP
jgi:hypothetical protein